jgi:hypothetical protein
MVSTLSYFIILIKDHQTPLDLRLTVATQSAEAIFIHQLPGQFVWRCQILILLDNECKAKVSDFGASALKSMDKNDFIILIQGTLGYLDPESFVSHHQTDKSDVYSFEECVQESYITNYLEYNKILLYKKSI